MLACFLMWLLYEMEVRTSPCHGCSVTGRIVAGDYNKIFAQNTSLKFNFVLDKFQYSHGRDKSLHYKSQDACLFSPLAAQHGGQHGSCPWYGEETETDVEVVCCLLASVEYLVCAIDL